MKRTGSRNSRRRAYRSLACLCLILPVVGIGPGCLVRQGRDFGHVVSPPAPFFHIQFAGSNSLDAFDAIENLLILPPVGALEPSLTQVFTLALWQELQQILPCTVHIPEPNGAYAGYITHENLVEDAGRTAADELARLGQYAGASHVLLSRVMDHRPHHPQRIAMEWTIYQVATPAAMLSLSGVIDLSEQRVLLRADKHLRERKASPYTRGNLDVFIRSPRAFCHFAIAETVEALNGILNPAPPPEESSSLKSN